MYFTDRGIEELDTRRGEESVTLAWLAQRLREFVDLNPEFETPGGAPGDLAGATRRRRRPRRVSGVFDERPVRRVERRPDADLDRREWPYVLPPVAALLRDGLDLPAG
jgi:hypothetical protein